MLVSYGAVATYLSDTNVQEDPLYAILVAWSMKRQINIPVLS